MPHRIELTPAALADFDDIYDYFARDNPRVAAQVLRSLDESIQLLSDQPKMGKVFRHRRLRFLSSATAQVRRHKRKPV